MLGCSLSAALFHFTCVAVFSYKINTSAAIPNWLSNYCNTFFYQDWKLFVPPPPNNYSLLVKMPGEPAIDVFAELRHQHQSNRVAGKGFELLAFVNYIHHFEKNTALPSGDVSNDAKFTMLQTACTKYINQTRKTNYKLLPLYLFVKPIRDFPPHTYFAY